MICAADNLKALRDWGAKAKRYQNLEVALIESRQISQQDGDFETGDLSSKFIR